MVYVDFFGLSISVVQHFEIGQFFCSPSNLLLIEVVSLEYK